MEDMQLDEILSCSCLDGKSIYSNPDVILFISVEYNWQLEDWMSGIDNCSSPQKNYWY